MPRYIIATVNSYHRGEAVEWHDGSMHVFYHGGEFEASIDKAQGILKSLARVGRTTVRLFTDSEQQIPWLDCKLAYIESKIEGALYNLLDLPVDTNNPSVYVTSGKGAEFHKGDLFTLGELILAEVTPGGVLQERDRVGLRNPHGEEPHAIEAILKSDETGGLG